MTYLGQSLKRAEDPRLITGQGSFVDDINLPGMLHVAVLRSPHGHAKLVAIDPAPALAMAGVVAVFTAGWASSTLSISPSSMRKPRILT